MARILSFLKYCISASGGFCFLSS